MSGKKDAKQLVKGTFKTVDEIRCRLFDHTQFTHGEIGFFIGEFQGKRSQSKDPLELLESMSESILRTNQSLEEAVSFLSSNRANQICDKIDDVTRFGKQEILDKEDERLKRMQFKDGDREKRLIDRQEVFQSIIAQRQKELDNRQSERIQDLKQKHQAIEQEIMDSLAS